MTGVEIVASERLLAATRDRAVLDLLMHLPAGLDPGSVWDLDCGAGDYVAMLARRYPSAVAHGVERREPLLAAARRRQGKVAWRTGGVETIDSEAGLIFSSGLQNPSETLIDAVTDRLGTGGALALAIAGDQDIANWHDCLAPRWSWAQLWKSAYLVPPDLEDDRSSLVVWSFVIALRR